MPSGIEWVTNTRRTSASARPASARVASVTRRLLARAKPGWFQYGRTLSTTSSRPSSARVATASGEVLAVLAAGGVAGVGAGDHGEHPAYAALVRLAQGVGDERVEVAVAPDERGRDLAPVELGPQRGQQRAVLVVDGAAPAEAVVVLGHGGQPLVRDAATGRDVAQERHHLRRAPPGRRRTAGGWRRTAREGPGRTRAGGSSQGFSGSQGFGSVEVEHDGDHADAEDDEHGSPHDACGQVVEALGHDDDERRRAGLVRRTARGAAPRAPGRRGRRAGCLPRRR